MSNVYVKAGNVQITSLCSGSRIIAILFLITLLMVACADDAVEPTEEEAAAIYATVIRQIYTEDDTHGGRLRRPRLYVVGTTDDRAGDPTGGEGDTVTLISPAVRQSISEQLADLPAEIVWVESPDEVERDADTGIVSGGGVIITLGNISPQEQDAIHVPASIYITPLGAGGQTYVLEKIDGVWTITGNTGVEWIS